MSVNRGDTDYSRSTDQHQHQQHRHRHRQTDWQTDRLTQQTCFVKWIFVALSAWNLLSYQRSNKCVSKTHWLSLKFLNWLRTSCLVSIATAQTLRKRKSLTVIYHHSLHNEFFPQLPLGVAFYLHGTYRFLIYVADLNYIMLLFDVGLGWVCKVMGWVGLGYRKWTHVCVCSV